MVFVVFLVFTASGILWSTLFMRRRRELDYACFSSLAENRNNLYELVNGIDEIKANCAQRQRVAAWDAVQNRINTLSLKTTRLKMRQNGGYVFFNRLRDIAITGTCATMVVHGEMTIGLMMTVKLHRRTACCAVFQSHRFHQLVSGCTYVLRACGGSDGSGRNTPRH